jgi:hypothetical protein
MEADKTERLLRIEPGRQSRGHWWMGWVVSLLMITLGVWLWLSGDRLLAALAVLVFLDMLAGTVRSWRWAVPYWLDDGGRLCRRGACRELAWLRAARSALVNAAFVVSMREGRLLLEWPDETWRVPLSLCGWEKLWKEIREARPDLNLPDWREDAVVRRLLAYAWNTPLCVPPGSPGIGQGGYGWSRAVLLGLAAAALVGAVVGFLGACLNLPRWLGGLSAGLAAVLVMRIVMRPGAEGLGAGE